MNLEVQSGDWSRVLAADTQATAFGQAPYNRAVRELKPTEDGVLLWSHEGSVHSKLHLLLQPVAQATAGVTFSMRVTTFRKCGTGMPGGTRAVWVQSAGWEFLCTVGEIPGLPCAGGPGPQVNADERFCRSVALTDGLLDAGLYTGWAWSMKPAANVPALVAVPVLGARVFKVEFASGDATASVGMNALWAIG